MSAGSGRSTPPPDCCACGEEGPVPVRQRRREYMQGRAGGSDFPESVGTSFRFSSPLPEL